MNIKEKYKEEIETKIIPYAKFLEANKSNTIIQNLYKGIITLQSPILKNPEILFIGINSGAGEYNEKNMTVLQMAGEDEKNFKELNWFQKGVAYGESINKEWHSYEWYQRNKRINNEFPRRMINILYKIAKIKYPNIKTSDDMLPNWYNDFGRKLMYSNLYPIATEDTTDLDALLSYLTTQKEFNEFNKDSKSKSIWELKLFFIKQTESLIKLVEPKVIVCMGKTAFNDLLYTSNNKGKGIFTGEKYKIPVVGFSRQGNWSNLIPDIAQNIAKKLI